MTEKAEEEFRAVKTKQKPQEKPFDVVIEWKDKDDHVLCVTRQLSLNRGDTFNFRPPTPDFNIDFYTNSHVIVTEFAKKYHKDALHRLKESIVSVTVRID